MCIGFQGKNKPFSIIGYSIQMWKLPIEKCYAIIQYLYFEMGFLVRFGVLGEVVGKIGTLFKINICNFVLVFYEHYLLHFLFFLIF